MTEIQFRSDVTVELVRSSAQDADVLFAARVSTQGEQTLESAMQSGAEVEKRDKGLINYLMRDRHGSPFEHNSMTFYVQAPIFVFREFMRATHVRAARTESHAHHEEDARPRRVRRVRGGFGDSVLHDLLLPRGVPGDVGAVARFDRLVGG